MNLKEFNDSESKTYADSREKTVGFLSFLF